MPGVVTAAPALAQCSAGLALNVRELAESIILTTTSAPTQTTPMSTQLVQRESRRFAALPHILAICLVALSLGGAPDARAADEGAITGRVLNPSTGEYLRNASVRLQETGLSATTEDGGVYRFSPISPGAYTVEVSYTGFHSAIATVQVAPGQTVAMPPQPRQLRPVRELKDVLEAELAAVK